MTTPEVRQLREEIAHLREQREYFRAVEEQYRRALRELRHKEEFNFALFQHNPIMTIVVDREGRVVKSNAARRAAGRLPNIGDIMYRDYASRHAVDMYGELMECMRTNRPKQFPQTPYVDQFLSITISPFPQGAIITTQDITEQVKTEAERTKLIDELRRALDEVEKLRGLLPICASCKKVRDDGGYWNTIESYISSRSNVDFSHTLCPDCMRNLYPEFCDKLSRQGRVPH